MCRLTKKEGNKRVEYNDWEDNNQEYTKVEDKKYKINPKLKNALEWIYCVLIAVVLALLVRFYLGTPTVVQQPSMHGTLEPGDRLILSRITRTFDGTYNRGDIVTFEAPSETEISPYNVNVNNPVAVYNNEPTTLGGKFVYYILELNKTSYIKRVVGLPGDHVQIQSGKVYINGKVLDEPYLKPGVTTDGGTFRDFTVPEGYFFLMGDNREHSTDCRNFGCIPADKIESKVWLRFWPLSEFGTVQ